MFAMILWLSMILTGMYFVFYSGSGEDNAGADSDPATQFAEVMVVFKLCFNDARAVELMSPITGDRTLFSVLQGLIFQHFR